MNPITNVGRENTRSARAQTPPAALDELAQRTGLPAAALSSMLLLLELDGVVTAENGRYARSPGGAASA